MKGYNVEDPATSHNTQGSTNKDMTAPWAKNREKSSVKVPDGGLPERPVTMDAGKKGSGGTGSKNFLPGADDNALIKNMGK